MNNFEINYELTDDAENWQPADYQPEKLSSPRPWGCFWYVAKVGREKN